MMMRSVELSPLDTERWGVVTAKANGVSATDVNGVVENARALGAALVIVRCSTADTDAAHALEKVGAEIMDTVVTFSRPLTDLPALPADSNIRLATPADAEIVRELARAAFAGYQGHYHADRRLDRGRCDEVYVDWAHRSVLSTEVADDVLVAEIDDGDPIGFATLKGDEGVLFGVAPRAQGRGVYRSLTMHGLARCAARGRERMHVTTQIGNLAVQKVWVRLGFEPSSSRYTFHLWLT